MSDPGTTIVAKGTLVKVAKSVWGARKIFAPTKLALVSVEPSWYDGLLTYHYKFKVIKPMYSLWASRARTFLSIPKDLGIAEFRLEVLPIQVRATSVEISALGVRISPHALIGNCWKELYDGQEITIIARIPLASKDVVEVRHGEETGCKIIKVKNFNNFALRACEIGSVILLNSNIHEIEIVKSGVVITQNRLVQVHMTYALDFEAGKLTQYFPKGISNGDNNWMNHRRTLRRGMNIRLSLDLEPNDEIEVRLYEMRND